MTDVFISYARVNRDTAQAVAVALEADGLQVWWDRELTGGGDFAAEIALHLGQAPVTIVLWSDASVRSDFVRDESSRARDGNTLLPVRIEPVALPLGFGTLHTLDLLDWDGDPDDEAYTALAAQVRARVATARVQQARQSPNPMAEPGSDDGFSAARLMGSGLIDPLARRRARRRWLLGLGGAGLLAAGGGGWMAWRGLQRREALAHLDRGLSLQFGDAPGQTQAQAQVEYRLATQLDPRLAEAHYYWAHLAVAEMSRGAPPFVPGEREGLRDDAVIRFTHALALPDMLGRSRTAVARQQVALLAEAEADPVARSLDESAASPGPTAEPARPASPPASASAPSPSVTPRTLPRTAAPEARQHAAAQQAEGLFTDNRDGRLAAQSALALDPALGADALPAALALATRRLQEGRSDEATRGGLIAVLALLARSTPAVLDRAEPAVEALRQAAVKQPGLAPEGTAARLREALAHADQGGAPVVYLQIAHPRQLALARQLGARMTAAGYRVPAIETTGESRAPRQPELRSQGGSDPGLARWCETALAQATGGTAQLTTLRSVRPRTDTYEIWFDAALCAPGGRDAPGCAGG